MVPITDICPDFLAFWDVAATCRQDEQRRLWHHLYEAPHRAIFDVYYRQYGQPAGLDAALPQFGAVAPTLRVQLPEIIRLVERVVPRCGELFATPSSTVPTVLMVGLFASDAWATTFLGTPTAFLALEVEHNRNPRTCAISLAHEAAHVLHQQCSSVAAAHPTVGEGLFFEGLAILASTLVVSGAPEPAYLWPGGDRTITGQACHAWVADCDRAWPELQQWLLHDFDRTDRYGSYFYVYPNAGLPGGLPMRAGYVAGYRLLQHLSQRYSIADLATWTRMQAMTALKDVLAAR